MTPPSFYDTEAERLAELYDRASFDSVHKHAVPYLPDVGAEVLDIGSGSGRDALALARRGYKVTAVEPADELREHASVRDKKMDIRWLRDRLPELTSLAEDDRRYSFILCSAVLMLLPPCALGPSFATMHRLLADGGRLAVTFRGRVSEDPDNLIFPHQRRAVQEAAQMAGFNTLDSRTVKDSLGRPDRAWMSIIFQKVQGLRIS